MRPNLPYQLLTIFVLATCSVQADKITLKDGKVIEGEVISETDTEYVVSVAYSKSIRTRKTFKKSEIADIQKEAPDLKPYEALTDVLPTPDRLSVVGYEQLIESRVKPFLNSFPNSKYTREVKKTLATLESELAKAKAGDVKLDGEWIDAAEWNANALELDAQVLVKRMKALAARKSYRSALLIYDKINIEFHSADAANDAAQAALQFLPKYSAQIKKLEAEAPAKLEKRDKALKAMAARDSSRMKKAYDEIGAKHQAALAKAKESRTKWLPVSEFDSRTLQTLARNIDTEINNIQRGGTNTSNQTSTSAVYRNAWEAAGRGNTNEVKRLQTTLRSRKIDNKYLQLISEHLAANPAKEEDPGPSLEEQRAAEAAKAKEAKAKADAERKAAAEEKRARRLRERAEQQGADDSDEEEESESSFLPILIAVVLLTLLIAFLVMKRKQSEE
ncbi:hypothetical protein OAF13_03230 [Akkermansiaceae bacterium]|nr:hypothetical protein [Akkermansiaceae bacterium]MDB4666717.1 hypothetical protein [bacterium]MDB4731044.1 hypothetical protein [Akkermansiaceae bacterium]MDB4792436.1 hypothetical protein [bacterium]